jgi:hypothetical protein
LVSLIAKYNLGNGECEVRKNNHSEPFKKWEFIGVHEIVFSISIEFSILAKSSLHQFYLN